MFQKHYNAYKLIPLFIYRALVERVDMLYYLQLLSEGYL